jgi:hypothetical protein
VRLEAIVCETIGKALSPKPTANFIIDRVDKKLFYIGLS